MQFVPLTNTLLVSLILTMTTFFNSSLFKFFKSAATKGWFVNTAVQLLESLLKFVEDLRPRFEEFEQRGIEKCGHSEYKADQQRVRKRNKLHWRALVFQVTSNKELSKKYSGTRPFMLIGTFEYAA